MNRVENNSQLIIFIVTTISNQMQSDLWLKNEKKVDWTKSLFF